MCGDRPVSLWVGFKWLLDFTMGKIGVDKAWRHANALRQLLETLGLAATHVCISARSQRNKMKHDIASSSSVTNEAPVDDWRISMMAAILFVESLIFNKRFGDSPAHKIEIVRKSKLALTVFLTWPRMEEETIAFALPKSRCEMRLSNMVVDVSALTESQKHEGKALRI